MFTKFWGQKPVPISFNKTYATIEFLTEDQKIQKDIILSQLEQEYQNDMETIIPYKDSFKYCFRQTINLPNYQNVMRLNQLIAHLQTIGGQIQQFMDNQVDKIIKVMQNNTTITATSFINLSDQMETFVYTPNIVIEIIISKKSTWNILKYKAKKVVKSIPGYLASLIYKIITYFFNMMGFNFATVMMKMIPKKTIINTFLSLLAVFFPPLGIVLGISKAII